MQSNFERINAGLSKLKKFRTGELSAAQAYEEIAAQPQEWEPESPPSATTSDPAAIGGTPDYRSQSLKSQAAKSRAHQVIDVKRSLHSFLENPSSGNYVENELDALEELQSALEEDRPQARDAAFPIQVSAKRSRLEGLKEPLTDAPLLQQPSRNLAFYFLTLHEVSGCPLLFGKALCNDSVVTCCVQVHHVLRVMYFKPRCQPTVELTKENLSSNEEVLRLLEPLKTELQSLYDRLGVKKWMYRPVLRSVVTDSDGKFSSGAQSNALVLKVCFESPHSLSFPPHGQFYAGVWGDRTLLSEHVLIKRRLKGPMWVTIAESEPVKKRVSTCALEVAIQSTKNIVPMSQEELRECSSVDLRISCLTVYLGYRITAKAERRVGILAGLVQHWNEKDSSTAGIASSTETNGTNVFLGVLKCDQKLVPLWNTVKVQQDVLLFESQSALLSSFLAFILKHDPDILLGHSLLNGDLGLLTSVSDPKRCSRLCYVPLQKISGVASRKHASLNYVAGRLVCDTMLQSRDLLRTETTYDLKHLVMKFFPHETLWEAIYSDLTPLYDNGGELKKAALACLHACRLTYGLQQHLKILSLTKELSNLTGHLWSRTLLNYRAERNDYLLLHKFHDHKVIPPDSLSTVYDGAAWAFSYREEDDEEATSSEESKKSYTGGLVLEPRCGLYDRYILLLDFTSLYPSIIQEHNICFTTVALDENGTAHITSPNAGLLPMIVKQLVQRRRQVKAAMQSCEASTRAMLDVRQLALKLTANSLYGCLGSPQSRFYCRPLATLITQYGRELLMACKTTVESKLCLDVIYGDTDSLMIDTGLLASEETNNYSRALEMAESIRQMINKPGSHLQLNLDAVFSRLLLLKKKKYACIKVLDHATKQTVLEGKGLDIVRRDWCPLIKQIGSQVLQILFDAATAVDTVVERLHRLLEDYYQKLQDHQVPLEQFCITKTLKKPPNEYPDAKHQPHVMVAKRLQASGHAIQPGLEIPYIICAQDSKAGLAERAYHPDEVSAQNLKIDTHWYITTQILPPLTRLCSHVAGTDSQRLAACFGIQHYETQTDSMQAKDSKASTTSTFAVELDDKTTSQPPAKLNQDLVICPKCRQQINFISCFETLNCPLCRFQISPILLCNVVQRLLHQWALEAHSNARRCQECMFTTRCSFLSSSSLCPQINCPQPKNSLLPVSNELDGWICFDYLMAALMKKCNDHQYRLILENLRKDAQHIPVFKIKTQDLFHIFA